MDKQTLTRHSIEILKKLISFNSESHLSNLSLINYIKGVIEQSNQDTEAHIHLSYDNDKKKANILISLPDIHGSLSGGILLSGHTDVVPVADQQWQTNPYEMIEKSGRLYGRGSCDMKGFVAVCLAMFPLFKGIKRRHPIHMAFSYDEEVGCLGAEVLSSHMKELGIIPTIAIIGEPTEMEIVIGHKGCCEYTTTFTGLPGHSSLPTIGVNAIEYAINYAKKLLNLRDSLINSAPKDSPFTPPYTTLQIGKIQGGSAHNIIAEYCSVDWQIRPIQQQDFDFVHEHIDQYAHEQLVPNMQAVYPQAKIDKQMVSEIKGLVPVNKSLAKKYLSHLTGKQRTSVVSYGTEAGIFHDLGCSTVVCGPGSIEQAHKADEFICIKQLEQCAEMLLQLQNDSKC